MPIKQPLRTHSTLSAAHPPVLIIVSRAGLSIFSSLDKKKNDIAFPESVVKDMEVVDVRLYKKSVKELVIQAQVRHLPALVIFDESSYFVKELVSEKSTQATGEQQTVAEQLTLFTQDLPFEDVLVKTIVQGKATYAVALNVALYEDCITALTEAKVRITAVVPFLVFPAAIRQDLSQVSDFYMKSVDALKRYSFWAPQEPAPQTELARMQPNNKMAVSPKLLLLLVLMVLLLVGVIISRVVSPPKTKKVLTNKPGETGQKVTTPVTKDQQVKTSSSSATAQASDDSKTNLTASSSSSFESTASSQIGTPIASVSVEVQNGSGVSGQANQYKELLEQAGFTRVTTGNAQQKISGPLLLQVKPGSDPTAVERLSTLLIATGKKIVVRDANPDQTADILVITSAQ